MVAHRIHPSFPGSTPPPLFWLCEVHSASRIYHPFLPEYTPLFNSYMRHSQNLPLPLRIYPVFQQLYATLPESTPASQNIPAFSTTICDLLRIYPFLQEYTPFSTTIILCDLPRIYLHKGYTFKKKENIPPFSTAILIMRPSQNLPAHRLYIF